MRRNNFDSIARFYDQLAGLVFGRAIKRSQALFLDQIKAGDHILIIGGGTGHVLLEIDKLNVPVSIDYIELSEAMLIKSRQQELSNNVEVNYSKGSTEKLSGTYDVIITQYFLDQFNPINLAAIINKLSRHQDKGGKWILADFTKTKIWWQRVLLKLMYLFFKLTTRIDADDLTDPIPYLSENRYHTVAVKKLYSGMIRGIYLRKL